MSESALLTALIEEFKRFMVTKGFVVTEDALLKALQPHGGRALIKPMGMASLSRGGIVLLPDKGDFSQERGVVVAVGPGEWAPNGLERRRMSLQVGDVIYYARTAAAPIRLGGELRYVVKDDLVQAVVPRGTARVVEHPEEENGQADHLDGEPCHRCRRPNGE